MIGHKQIIDLRMNGYKPKSVFISFSKPVDAEKDIEMNSLPTVYAENSDPYMTDLSWAKGLFVQLMPSDDIAKDMKWWCALVDVGVKNMVAIDSDGELNVY